MKLFLKEHFLLIVFQCIQGVLILSIFTLAGFKDFGIIFYVILLNGFLLLIYLLQHYIRQRKFYNRLENETTSLEDTFQRLDETAISKALKNLLSGQFNDYKEQLMIRDQKQEEHLTFLDLWIHQMKTPLSVIELTAQELDESDSSNIREEVDQLKEGLQTVLYMSRMRMLENDLHPTKISLKDLIYEVCDENKRLFIRNRVYPKIDSDEEVMIYSDEKWLFFIVNQLLHNAVKYSAKKADEIIIKITTEKEKEILEITDFGVGIPEEDLPRLYEAFYTGQNGRLFRESTGVGLYLAHEVLEVLNHDLEVISEVNVGTTFRIIF